MKIRLLITVVITGVLVYAAPAGAQGDPTRGKKVFNKCKACHAVKEGKHKIGPSLYKVLNRKAGTASGFKNYRGLKGADWNWSEQNLDEYLKNPKKFVKQKTKKRSSMVLKLKKKRDRDDIIAYLKSLN